MSDDSHARNASAAPSSADPDYDAIHATIVATGRGRWFLDEYVNRYRGADTERVLAAVERIERALRGSDETEAVSGAARSEFAAMLDTLRQVREEVVGRHGDPAASGEAALADFRHAVDQVRELVWAAHGREAGSDLDAQLTFQTNRLASAGERLERSVAGLRALLALLDDFDRRLGLLVNAPGAAGATPSAPPLSQAPDPIGAADADTEWAQPAAAETALSGLGGPLAESMLAVGSPPQPPTDPEPVSAEPLWDLTVDSSEPVPDQTTAGGDQPSEAAAADWAFAINAAGPEPSPDPGWTAPPADSVPPPDRPPVMSALERLEAREYGRRQVATARAPLLPEEPDTSPPAIEPAWPPEEAEHPPPTDVLSDPVAEVAPELDARGTEPPPDPAPPQEEWFAGPAAPTVAAEPIFDADLFENDDRGEHATPHAGEASAFDTADLTATDEFPPGDADAQHDPLAALAVDAADITDRPSSALQAMAAQDLDAASPRLPPTANLSESAPEPHASARLLATAAEGPDLTNRADPQRGAGEAAADMPSVLHRLESMRSAIASLMDEVSEKTARRGAARLPEP